MPIFNTIDYTQYNIRNHIEQNQPLTIYIPCEYTQLPPSWLKMNFLVLWERGAVTPREVASTVQTMNDAILGVNSPHRQVESRPN